MFATQRRPETDPQPNLPSAFDHAVAIPAAAHRLSDRQRQDRELVEITYYPVLKNHTLGRRMKRTIPAHRGENPYLAAERALGQSYKVRDYLIFDAHVTGA